MDPIDTKAYAVFVRESKGYMTLLNELIGPAVSEERLKEIRIAAHRLKGGAGFFGLKRIRELAGVVEETCERGLRMVTSEQTSLKATIEELSTVISHIQGPK